MKNIQITTNHKRGGKAREKCVLSLDLKLVTEGVSLIEGGGSLQRRGAATAKALSPLCFNLVRGTCRRPMLHDLRDLGGQRLIKEEKYRVPKVQIFYALVNCRKRLKTHLFRVHSA